MRDPKGAELAQLLDVNQNQKISIEGLCGSRDSFLILSSFLNQANPFLIICSDKEEAAYLQNDLEQFSKQTKVYFLPDSFRRPAQFEEMDTFQIQQRVDAISKLNQNAQGIIVSYPEAIFEKMISGKAIEKSKVEFATGSKLDLDDILIKLNQFGFNRTDFVYEPGQFSVRGGILDVFLMHRIFLIELN